MTDAEMEQALRTIVEKSGGVAQDPLAFGYARTLAKAIAMLAVVVGELWKRRKACGAQ